jgi:gliding motility-associated-like protein
MSKTFFKAIGRLAVVCTLLFCTSQSFGQEVPVLEWAKSNSGNALSVAIDASGNVYTTGSFTGTTDFDPGPAIFNLSTGIGTGNAAYISKLDANGNFVWAKAIENANVSGRSVGNSIVIANTGDVYISGDFTYTSDFDPGAGVFNLVAPGFSDDIFILKLDINGNFVWAARFGSNFLDYGKGIATDAAGNVYATGFFENIVDFDPGPGIFNLGTAGSSNKSYILKLDASGNFVWAKAFVGTTSISGSGAEAIFIDASNNVHIAGDYTGTVDFDSGVGTLNLSTGWIATAYITKLDSDGNLVWAKSMNGWSEAFGISVDPLGNVLTTGVFVNVLDVDPGLGTTNLTSVANSGDIFISKLDVNGDFVWGRSMGGTTVDHGRAIATDATGNVYTTGFFYRTVDFDPGAGVFNLTPNGGVDDDFFVSKLDASGNFVWALKTGGINRDRGNSIRLDASGTVYVAGFYSGSTLVDFDFGPCILNLPSSGRFVEKITIGTVIPSPVLTSFTPTVGPIGTSVTISGTGFSTTPNDNVVKFFNDRTATVTASTPTSITAVVPASTTTGVISVTTNCLTATSATNFTIGVAPPPTITSFTPASGPIGTTVTITGTNFSTTPANNIVFFGATQAIVSAATATQLTVTVPVGATYQPVTVNVAGLIAYSAMPFTVTFSGGGIIDPCSFAAKVDFTTGLDPSSVSISDLDGDGKADLAVSNANPGGNTISVLRNTGSGPGNISYAAKVDFITGTGSQPWSVSAGDLNGDGKADLAVANSAGNFVSVFRNTSSGAGNINFAAKLDFATGVRPQSVSIADLDGDGKPDLALANLNSNTISVFRNTSSLGSISFASKVDFATGTAPRSVSIADLDGDGKPDLAVVNSSTGSNSVSVIRNTSSIGSISFATKVDFATGTQPYAMSIGDLDGDDKPDLAVTNFNSNTVSLFRNTSSIGVINYAVKVDFTTGASPISVTIGDLDGNGKVDLAVANFSDNTLSVFRNTSSISNVSFSSKVDFTSGSGPYLVSIGDLDGDGKADLVSPNVISDNVSVFRNTIGSISPLTITSFTPTSGAIGASVAITGTNFDIIPTNNILSFNGIATSVTASTSTTINTTVPAGATSGKITVTIGCNSAISAADFVVTMTALPTITSFTPPSGPVGTTVTITGTNFSTTPANNTVTFNGTTAAVTASTTTSITTTVPAGATAGTITVTVAGNTTTSATNFTVTASPVIIITTQPSSFTACVGQTATFTTAATGTTNITYQWQFSPDGVVPYTDIANGGGYSNATTATLSVNTIGNFGLGRYRCRINGDFAPEVITNDEGLFINPISTAPTVVGANRCGAGSVTLTASGGTNGQYKWYTTPTGGTAIVGEPNSSYVTPSITSTTSYYVSLNTNGCESNRTLVTATLTIAPAPTATGVSGCPASAVTLTASGGANGQYNWYTVATGGTAITGATNNTYQIPSLAVTSTFYVSLTISGCESTRTPVTATLLATGCAPVITTQTLSTQVEGKIEINLQSLITTPGTLDPTSIKIVTQPASGAVASITNFLLVIDYKGKPFSGKETIIIEACNTNGLCAQQTFTIEVAGEVIVFNAVSPNGDGKNEFLVLQYIESISPKNQVSIYNRWGDEVFSISDYDNKTRVFAGLSNGGSKLPAGTYFYKINLPSLEKTITGFLALKY